MSDVKPGMLLNKANLIAALKKRRQAIVDNHMKRVKSMKPEIEKYRRECLKTLKSVEAEIRAAKTCFEMRDIGSRVCIADRDYPKPPHKRPNTAGIDKTLVELELLDESVLTVESHRNYLSALAGEYDQEKDYDDDDDYDDEE